MMNLYEVVSDMTTWWIATYSMEEVASILKEELELQEYSDEEIDLLLEEIEVFKANKTEVEGLLVDTPYMTYDYSIWDLFIRRDFPGVITSDKDLIDPDLSLEDELEF